MLPGAGATIASAITYMVEKNLTDREGTFGKGDVRGVAAPEAANNAAAHGAFVPMLTLGVPGSGTTAVMVGALTLYNITPGPLLFEQQPDLVWGLIASMFIGNVMLLVMNIPMVGIFARMLYVPNWFLVPAIAAVSFVGVYAVHATTFDLVLMVALGIFGWGLRKLGFPMAPLILGFVLGDMMEQNLRRALVDLGRARGDPLPEPGRRSRCGSSRPPRSRCPSCCGASSRRASARALGYHFGLVTRIDTMKVLGIAGYSGSGKTTLIEKLVPLLVREGLRVSLIKHAHHEFEVDHAGQGFVAPPAGRLHRGAGELRRSAGRSCTSCAATPEPTLQEQLRHLCALRPGPRRGLEARPDPADRGAPRRRRRAPPAPLPGRPARDRGGDRRAAGHAASAVRPRRCRRRSRSSSWRSWPGARAAPARRPPRTEGRMVTLLYFASLRERLDCAREEVALPPAPRRWASSWTRLRARDGRWSEAFAPGRAWRVAVNQRMADLATPLKPGDEVAFFPPVTGG